MSSQLPKRQWLTLSEASSLLGVHPATLRTWADEGYIQSFRTPGGHRRFLASEVEAMVAPAGHVPREEPMVRELVDVARREISTLQRSEQGWLAAFPGEARTSWRDSGRRLIGLAIQYVSRRERREAVMEEGRDIGRLYGRQCAAGGLSLSNTVRAFLFFRESLLRSTRPGLLAPGRYDAEDARIHREMREFLDDVMYAMLDAYEAAPKGLPAGEK